VGAFCIRTYPNGLAFFNPFVGGPDQATRYVADSNIDWGQAWRDAGRTARRAGITHLRVAAFSFDNVQRFFEGVTIEPVPVPWTAQLPNQQLIPQPGWYAISASLLPGQYFQPQYRDYFAEFARRKPYAVAGGSIFIYRIPSPDDTTQ
jgi:hypothetical protein